MRPGTVPMAANRILWFEFLLDQTLLENHIKKENPDPTTTELIVQLLANAQSKENDKPDAENNGQRKAEEMPTRKALALKYLVLKIASYLKWDLTLLGSKIPLKMQQTLLQDLVTVTSERPVDPYQFGADVSTLPDHVLFAVSLYHRWCLRAVRNHHVLSKPDRTVHIAVPGQQDPAFVTPAVTEALMRNLESRANESVAILENIVALRRAPLLPTFETFSTLREGCEVAKHAWDKGVQMSSEEFACQLHYDLGCFCFFKTDYKPARNHISKAANFYEQLEGPSHYLSIKEGEMKGYCIACGIKSNAIKETPTAKFHNSVRNKYNGMIDILRRDNVTKEIRMVYRDVLETDLQAVVTNKMQPVPDSLLPQVQAHNIVRRVLEDKVIVRDCTSDIKKPGVATFLKEAFADVMDSATAEEKKRVREFVKNLPKECGNLSQLPDFDSVAVEVKKLPVKKSSVDKDEQNMWQGHDELRFGELRQTLMSSYDPSDIAKCMDELAARRQTNLLKLNMKWDLPIPLQSVILGLPEGHLQDYCYIFLAKSKELLVVKKFAEAKSFLDAVQSKLKKNSAQLGNDGHKLSVLILWETLLVDIIQFFHDWPNNTNADHLKSKCKELLMHGKDKIIPRTEVVEYAESLLLNVREWSFVSELEARSSYMEMATALAGVCHAHMKMEINKKSVKDAWDMVTPMFVNTLVTKRVATLAGGSVKRDNATGGMSLNTFNQFIQNMYDATVLSILISLLSRLYNVLKDEPNAEITLEHPYIHIWPAVISNPMSYNLALTGEYLGSLLDHALSLYPTNVPWLKISADLNFVTCRYPSAMRRYVEAGAVASDYFNQQVPKGVFDNQTYRRMVRCCTQMDYFTQAAVLCQFLEAETDYSLIWKCLQEKNCGDGMDFYYNSFWDVTVLEFLVCLHHKRGEVQKKQAALKVMGLLELNSNNNEEIKREAANIRKSRFLRALAKQYNIITC